MVETMGSRAFDFLAESFLFDNVLIQDKFRTISEQEILNELSKYREFCLSNQRELEEEVLANQSSFKVVSGIEIPDLMLLKQSAFYIEQYIISDPIFALTYKENSLTIATKTYYGMNEELVDKVKLAEVAAYMKSLTPMVVADYVKFFPISYFFETPEQLPILYSNNGFDDVLPEQIINFFKENAIINSLDRLPNNPRLIKFKELQPCREIAIQFREHLNSCHYFYTLGEIDSSVLDGQEGEFSATIKLLNTPPDRDEFIAWVNQSFYLSCKQLYDGVFRKNLMAAKFGSAYLSESQLVFSLLSQVFSPKEQIKTNTANIMMNIELPFLENVDIDTIMNIRMNYGEEFQNFRVHLDKQFRDLRLIKDPEELKIKAENALHELTEVQLHAISQRVRQIRRSSWILDGTILLASLATAIQTGGLSIAGLAVAAARGYKPFTDYSNQIRQNPAFFLWKVLKEPRK
ncbi:hypothetical protein H6F50_23395 [Coleofasciculus sp. FACHB-712]|uniref:hypothetical protein n=1 Tax=Coleofasciculus sp. FACHB-712 TaxID=2692789 RepID=UPI001689B332|nr:hypothetical protein [Coleofasciculus sp. FACHB-712]MBD1945260.1 hypothetical protein [Coleofasciculus sp. FACHB-712]